AAGVGVCRRRRGPVRHAADGTTRVADASGVRRRGGDHALALTHARRPILQVWADVSPRTVRMPADDRLFSEHFPRSSKYHPDWVLANASGGANSLWLTEWLTTAVDLRPGMRVLDL